MSRDQIIKIAMVVCGVIVACAVIISVTGIFGGGSSVFGYANAEKYTAGDTEISGEIRNLDVNWTSGKVNVEYHAGSSVIVKETSSKTLSEDQQMHWWLDGDTLRIQFCKSGFRFSWGNVSKELTVLLPEGTVLKNAEISLTSGDLNVKDLKAEDLSLGTTSGDVNATAEAEKADIGSTSGDLNLKLTGDVKRLKAGSTSGSIRLEAGKVKEIEAGSTSGGIDVRAEEVKTVKIGCTSGSVYVKVKKLEKLHVSTTSGSVTAALSEEPGFTADIGTVSGNISTGMAVTKNGSKYVCGDGSAEIELGTVSGSVRLEAAE